MGQDLALNSDHDLDFNGDDFILTAGPDKTAQSILIRLWAYLGEWFLDTSIGTPHYQQVLGQPFRPNNQAAVYRRRILNTEGVRSIENFSFARVGRDLEVNAIARLADGSRVPINITV